MCTVNKKRHPPILTDEVWRLEKIGKNGAFHKKLSENNINNIQDFLKLLMVYPARLRHVSSEI
jgi:Calmodulin binding protein-like